MVQLSCSFATNCTTKCYFSRAGQGRQQLIPLNSWVYSLKKTFERRRCIPNMRFVRDGAYSSAYWLIWRLLRPRFHDVPQISCTTWREIQTFGFVNASFLLIKIGDIKWERERWICRWQKKSKLVASLSGGGKVTVNLNRTPTVAAILESTMNKEEGQEEHLSEHQFS